ncbi:MAG TPA: BTAD domain-containing putative transcriptional regulator [Ktedonobacteraceae bacterium]|nr:BTAD domain-containing putative transcriptional regulator [Ktedonobacteraceae bacterium]
MAAINLYLFGLPRIVYQGRAIEVVRRKALALMAYLALTSLPQSRDVLATLLWPDLDQERARAALRSTLPALTSLFPESWLTVDRQTIRLNREVIWIDTGEFLALLAQSRSHQHPPDTLCPQCLSLLEHAIALYHDDFLTGFTIPDSVEYDDWQMFQRGWLRREYAGALRKVAGYYGGEGHYQEALAYARRWLSLDPLHEPAHRMMMQLYAANGQRAEALRQYSDCVAILDAELATPPEEETTALYKAIKANTVTALPKATAISPAYGVLPPLPSLVVGRERVLQDLKERVGIGGEPRPVTVVQGWPGVGKSTIVAALAHDPDIAQAFPDGVLWTSLGESPDLLAELMVWAKSLRITSPGQVSSLETITAQFTAVLRDRRMLLIVDDLWQVEHAAPFKVGGHACALVMTSRLNDVAQALAPTSTDLYRLPVLTDEPALELLGILSPKTVADYPDEARALVRDLEGLPLAIQVAGRLLQNEVRLGWGVGELLAELREGAGLLAAQAPSDMLGAGRDTTPTIAALLKRSTDALDVETRERFAYLGLFAPKPATFDLQAMAVAWDLNDPRPTVRILVNRGLLEPVSGGRFQLHALLALHARSLLEE